MADIVCWPAPGKTLWVEVKRPHGGVQLDAQSVFERFVTGIGHTYVIATSVEDLTNLGF